MNFDQKTGRFLPQFDATVAVGLYNQGKSLDEIGEILGVSKAAVSYRFKELGIPVKRSEKKIEDVDIVLSIKSGYEYSDICTKYGVSRKTLEKRLRRMGLNGIKDARKKLGIGIL